MFMNILQVLPSIHIGMFWSDAHISNIILYSLIQSAVMGHVLKIFNHHQTSICLICWHQINPELEVKCYLFVYL